MLQILKNVFDNFNRKLTIINEFCVLRCGEIDPIILVKQEI